MFCGLTTLYAQQKTFVLPAHSHNDYEHNRPLFDALECNFKSIEADVYAVGDSLFVSHNFEDIKPGRTLRQLYLEPLKKRIVQNKGSVYGNGEDVILFIDIKDDGLKTYKLLHKILEGYKNDLTVFENGVKKTGKITVVVSGNRPFEYMKSQKIRYAGYDGRIEDLDSDISSDLMTVVSDNWVKCFKWDGKGKMPETDKQKLAEFVKIAISKGYILRFWNTPNQTAEQRIAVWKELKDSNIGLIGTDNLQDLQIFLMKPNSKNNMP